MGTRGVACRSFGRGFRGERSSPRLRQQAPLDKSTCTLGRRPDVFNGDASRLLPTFPSQVEPAGVGAGSLAEPSSRCVSSSQTGLGPAAAWCSRLRYLHSRALHLRQLLDASLADLENLNLATGPELRTAQRLHKVLSTWLSFAPGTAAVRTGALHHKLRNTGTSTHTGGGEVPESFHSESPLHSLLGRVEVAAAQLSEIGVRHDADVYGQLRRFYFSPEEPLTAIPLRAEQYRRHLERAVESCGPHSAQVAALIEEVAAALSSRTVAAFLALDLDQDQEAQLSAGAAGPPAGGASIGDSAGGNQGGSMAAGTGGSALGRLAAAAAADYWALQELRQELEVVGRSAEAAGVPLAQLLQLADAAAAPAADGPS